MMYPELEKAAKMAANLVQEDFLLLTVSAVRSTKLCLDAASIIDRRRV
jgi:hypothetical protein